MTSDLKWLCMSHRDLLCIFGSLTATGSRFTAVIQYLYAKRIAFSSEEKKL